MKAETILHQFPKRIKIVWKLAGLCCHKGLGVGNFAKIHLLVGAPCDDFCTPKAPKGAKGVLGGEYESLGSSHKTRFFLKFSKSTHFSECSPLLNSLSEMKQSLVSYLHNII